MADEIHIQHPTSVAALTTVYAILRNAIGQPCTISNATFAAYATGSLSTYKIALTEQGTASRFYSGNMPSGVAAGDYTAYIFQGTGVEGDTYLGAIDMQWDGSVVVSRYSRMATFTQPSGFLAATFPTVVASPDNIWDELHAEHLISGSFGSYVDAAISGISSGGGASAAAVADAVWDELRSGHTIDGSFGDGVFVSGQVTLTDAVIAAIRSELVKTSDWYKIHYTPNNRPPS